MRRDRRSQTRAVREERRRTRDRRVHHRVLVSLEVDYRHGDTFLFSYITDLSAVGIFIRTGNPHPPGTTLNLRFSPPGGSSIDIEGRVVWVTRPRPDVSGREHPGMGIQLLDITAAQQEQIMGLVRTFAYLSDQDDPIQGHS